MGTRYTLRIVPGSGSFRIYNHLPVEVRERPGLMVGVLHIHRNRAWSAGGHGYVFCPNEAGEKLGFVTTGREPTVKRALAAGVTEGKE